MSKKLVNKGSIEGIIGTNTSNSGTNTNSSGTNTNSSGTNQ